MDTQFNSQKTHLITWLGRAAIVVENTSDTSHMTVLNADE